MEHADIAHDEGRIGRKQLAGPRVAHPLQRTDQEVGRGQGYGCAVGIGVAGDLAENQVVAVCLRENYSGA